LALIAGGGAYALHWPVPAAVGGDVFFAAYLVGSGILAMRVTRAELDKGADVEDEGMLLVFVLTLGAIAFACVGVFDAINEKNPSNDIAPLIISMIGAPLGWFMLHTVMAFHYANIFYVGTEKDRKKGGALEFPGEEEPGVLDFLYYSFVVGMTAQVSDVQVRTTPMRRATLVHGIVSFFFNTVLIAMAVNAVVAKAG
jgi:uncharacterized membrane protein